MFKGKSLRYFYVSAYGLWPGMWVQLPLVAMSVAHVSSVLLLVTECFPCLVQCIRLAMLSICRPLISGILIGSFLQFVCFSLSCHLMAQILGSWYQVQSPSLLRLFWILARRIPDHCQKRLVRGFRILRTLLSYALSQLVRCCWGVCWFQNTWSNNPQQWGRFFPVF